MRVHLRQALPEDATALWNLFRQVIADGTTYAADETTQEGDFLRDWTERGGEQWVAVEDVRVLGAYTLRPNQPGRGAHIATASYLVDADAQGRGIGRSLGAHSIERARTMGFAAIQFNFVVSTNSPAVHLWKSLGFEVLATLPRAFNHRRHGRVDAYVMWLSL